MSAHGVPPAGTGRDAQAAGAAWDEPDLLRDQFRQLLRYRWLIALGIVLGLLGGGWLGISGGASYNATTEITVRPLPIDGSGERSAPGDVSMGSERRTALSSVVADRAARILRTDGSRIPCDLQVTNPPETRMLRFSCTAPGAGAAARAANAYAEAYLDNREEDAATRVRTMVDAYEKQRAPLLKERDRLAAQIASSSGDDRALDGTVAAHSSAVSRIAELNGSISDLRAEDTTPGRVVTKATPPAAPSGPGLPLLLGLGAAVGIGLGLLAAWVRLVFDPAVRSPGDVVRALHAPVLGTLPHGRRARRDGNGRADRRSLLAVGRLAEEYRSVAFRLAYDETFARRRRILLVPPRGSIATALAASVNLAASFAEMGKEVLLLEADLRTPSLTERLQQADGVQPGWARAPGHGTIGWPAGYRIPIDAGESGVFDLVPGHRVSKVPRALTSSAVTQLIAHADDRDAVLIVLAPAVLGYADAIALIDRVDCVLIVCDPREVRRDDLARIRELVTGAGGCVLGALLHSEGAGSEPRRGARPAGTPPPRGPRYAGPHTPEYVREGVGLRVMDR
ncbi:P-loop NTPase family protein [Streptomyces albus]|uniref:Lipopolysaccharide biosynthesis protein n=1 Tax=Streptomyces albus TaxID=1888 RepID=A0A8H1LCB9_9ACTN|nr:LPS biosynthesis protein [Streptomyces albus]TGG83194.1 lipopolysaccharide biosynthesis protein [Streptomyces albus]UVN57075.1 lipopolysaccharide biosynthesis protein [Streptomyces albus]